MGERGRERKKGRENEMGEGKGRKEKRNYSANKKCAYMLSSFSHV